MKEEKLKERFLKQMAPYQVATAICEGYWQEIYSYYNADKRHYHNLEHLHALFAHLDAYRENIADVELLSWCIWYHDIIYNARRTDNENQSAILAEERLSGIGVPKEKMMQVVAYIQATAKHLSVEASGDLAWFLDFDLAILGAESTAYEAYTSAVRKEYRHVPGFLYRRGRRKVLRYFLEAESLFRTEAFRMQYQKQAKINLAWELNQ